MGGGEEEEKGAKSTEPLPLPYQNQPKKNLEGGRVGVGLRERASRWIFGGEGEGANEGERGFL